MTQSLPITNGYHFEIPFFYFCKIKLLEIGFRGIFKTPYWPTLLFFVILVISQYRIAKSVLLRKKENHPIILLCYRVM